MRRCVSAWGFVVGLSLASALACAADLTPEQAVQRLVEFQRIVAKGGGKTVEGPPANETGCECQEEASSPGYYRVLVGYATALVRKSDGFICSANLTAGLKGYELRELDEPWDAARALKHSTIEMLANRYAKAAGFPLKLKVAGEFRQGVTFFVCADRLHAGVVGPPDVSLRLHYRTGRLLELILDERVPAPPAEMRPRVKPGAARDTALGFVYGAYPDAGVLDAFPAPQLCFWQPAPVYNAERQRSFLTPEDLEVGQRGGSLLVWRDDYACPGSFDGKYLRRGYMVTIDARDGRVLLVEAWSTQEAGKPALPTLLPKNWEELGKATGVFIAGKTYRFRPVAVAPSSATAPNGAIPVVLSFGSRFVPGGYDAGTGMVTACLGDVTLVGVPSGGLAKALAKAGPATARR